MINKLFLLVIGSCLLSACATYQPTIPDGYVGPRATFEDTVISIDSGKADFFYLSHVDGIKIEDSRIKSVKASSGQGDHLSIVLEFNNVTAEEHVLTIVGRTVYAMPIRALTGKVFEVKGNITFSPKPNERYIVKGDLSEEHSAVWVEEASSGEVIEKIQLDGSAKLDLWQK